MAESVNSHDEHEFTVTDAMLANLILSPPQTSTQLTVVAEPPDTATRRSLACGVVMLADDCPVL